MSGSENQWDRQERRTEADRRTSNRQGKFDRRRNRCSGCLFFDPRPGESVGYCRQHDMPMSAEAFVCPLYQHVESV